MEFELDKRSEVRNVFNKFKLRPGDREFEQSRAILFNIVIDAITVTVTDGP